MDSELAASLRFASLRYAAPRNDDPYLVQDRALARGMLSGCVAPVAIAGDNVGRSNCENSQQANVFRISSTAVIQRDEAMAVLLRRQPDTFSGTLDNEAPREWVLTIS